MKTAVIYARFSCSKQREASIDDQLRVCHDWCTREGYTVVAEYCDYAMSGRTDSRPEFQKMIANAGESDIVLVYMMDRFSRDPFDAPIYKRELERKGVRLVSSLEAIPDSPEGIIYEKLLEGLAACESRKTSIRTRRGMEGNALQCKTNGVRVYGYYADETDHYAIDIDQAVIVREIFNRRLNGEAVSSIASDLAMRGVKTYTGRKCSHTMVNNILHNRKYMGLYSWAGIEKKDGMPRIIDDDTFYAVQTVKGKKQRKNESWGDFMLAGKIICAECGRNIVGTSGRGRGNKKYEYYACKNCKSKPIRKEQLESMIVEAIRSLMSDRKEALRVAEIVIKAGNDKSTEDDMRVAKKSLREAEDGLNNILQAIEAGVIHPNAKERMAELEAQKARAERDIKELEAVRIDLQTFADFLQFGATLDDASLLDAFVYQVLIDKKELVVSLNYSSVANKNEPARLTISRVRTISNWLPGQDSNLRHAD
ncbi:recombinase family protein [Atopobium sp.]|uniref:recombinase family protein n=1 Tax=Atopobium sp. TaxID=1872650 RepID=UPI0039C1148E